MSADAPEDDASNMVPLPRLPAVPQPPSFPPDPHQAKTRAVISGLTKSVGEGWKLGTVNLSTGFPAASVDVRALKDALEDGLAVFSMEQLRARWARDVRDWVHAVLRTWVQRAKTRSVTLEETGVHIRLETQDDDGYYAFEFDAFPSRSSGP